MEKVISELQKGLLHLREGQLKTINYFCLVEGDRGWHEGHGAFFASSQAGSFQFCCPKKVSFGGLMCFLNMGSDLQEFPCFPLHISQ